MQFEEITWHCSLCGVPNARGPAFPVAITALLQPLRLDSNNRELQMQGRGADCFYATRRRQCEQQGARTAAPPAPDVAAPSHTRPRLQRRSCIAARKKRVVRAASNGRHEGEGELTANSQKSSRSFLTTLAQASQVCTSFPFPIPPCLRSSNLPNSASSGDDVRPASLPASSASSPSSWSSPKSEPTSSISDSCRRIAAAPGEPLLSSASLMCKGADEWDVRPEVSACVVVGFEGLSRWGTRWSLLVEGWEWRERQERSRRLP